MANIDFDIERNLQRVIEEKQEDTSEDTLASLVVEERKVCDNCSSTFKNDVNLRRHKRKYHPYNDDEPAIAALRNEVIEIA